MGTLVRAIAPGSFNGSRVRVGKEFMLPDGVKPGHWLEVVKVDPPAAEAKAEKAAPMSLPKGKGKDAEDLPF